MARDSNIHAPPNPFNLAPLALELARLTLRVAIGLAGVLSIVLLAQAFYWAVARLLPLVAPILRARDYSGSQPLPPLG